MKHLLLLALFSVATIGLYAQPNAIDEYFQNYVEDEQFTVVYISPRLFQMFEKIGDEKLNLNDAEAEAFRDLATDLRGLRILSTDRTPEKFFREAKAKINTRDYETLLTIRDREGGNTELLLREDAQGKLQELLFLSYGDEEFTMMSFVGPLNLDKVLKLANEMEKN
jgi:hypothetical protein